MFLYSKSICFSSVVEYREYESDGGRFIFFKNTTEAERLSYIYLDNLEKGEKGYSMEEHERQRKKYGVILLETNLKERGPERYIATTKTGGP